MRIHDQWLQLKRQLVDKSLPAAFTTEEVSRAMIK